MIQAQRRPAPTVSAEVLAFAAEQGVSAYLPRVLEMTRCKFPDALHWGVQVELDPEIPNDRHLVVEVTVAGLSPEEYVQADDEWGRELFDLCPAPLVSIFRLGLESL